MIDKFRVVSYTTMHELQKILLKRLQTEGPLRYASLTSGYDFEDNVVFHLKQLETKGLLTKSESKYEITTKGVKRIAAYEPTKLDDRGAKIFFIGFLCSNENGEYLLKSHPQAKVNFYNLPSGKPYFGEDPGAALVRLFKYNAGLELTPERFKFTSLHLKSIRNKEGEALFDDAFAIYRIRLNATESGSAMLLNEVNWFTAEQIARLENCWPEVDLCTDKGVPKRYTVYTYISNYIL